MRRGFFAMASLWVLAAGAAHAGLFVETVDRDAKSGAVRATQTMRVQGGSARFERAGERIVIFAGDALTTLEPAKQTYTVMDRATITRMASRMNDAMAKMHEQMAGMPPEQRAAMERMLAGQGVAAGAKPRPKIEVVDTGRSETVEGRRCRVWDVKRGGVLDEQHCVVPFDSLPGKQDLLALFEHMNGLFGELRKASSAFAAGSGDEYEALTKMNGFPVLTRDYENGKPTGRETRVRAWREESMAAALFEVPSGYHERELPQ